MQSAAVSGQSGRFCSGFYWKQVPMEGILPNLFLWSALRGMWEAPDVFIRPSQTKVCFARIESWSSASEIGISSKSKTTRKYNDFRGGEEGGRGRVDWGQLGPSWSSNSSGDENCLCPPSLPFIWWAIFVGQGSLSGGMFGDVRHAGCLHPPVTNKGLFCQDRILELRIGNRYFLKVEDDEEI